MMWELVGVGESERKDGRNGSKIRYFVGGNKV